MAGSAPRVFTIPASAPFLPTLIGALMAGRLVPDFPKAGDPLALSTATLYLPTRRACRLARDAFLDHVGGDAAILPRIVAIGDIDEDEIIFAQQATGAIAEDALLLPPALGGFERKILLGQIVLSWAARLQPDKGAPLVASNPAAAWALAEDLARLMDDMTTRNVPWSRLDELVPDGMDDYWQLTLRFLKIAREHWPAILAERGAIEPAARRDRLIAAEAERLRSHHPGPVIAAGSTGSMPSTAMLLETVAKLPNGALVLPGLDTDLDEESWKIVTGLRAVDGQEILPPSPGHPQFSLAALLRRIGITRADVSSLHAPLPHGREALISEALRPALATDLWRGRLARASFAAQREKALERLTVIDAANAEEEALAVAIALRETVEMEHRTAALITPDRALARRVLSALERWNVPVDDSGGDALTETPAGRFALLAAKTALEGVEPVTLLAVLKHPLLRLGAHEFAHDDTIAALERAVLRGPRPRAGSQGLRAALDTLQRTRGSLHRNDPRSTLDDDALAAAAVLAEKLADALAPLEHQNSALPFGAWASAHRDVVTRLTMEATGDIAAFGGADGNALSALLDEIANDPTAAALPIAKRDYLDLIRAAMADRIVRRPGAPGSRVRILGPLEARMQQADRVVLGGLVEGVWPPESQSDPWLSRPMRHQLGLDLPERRIGLSAHDFAQALGAPDIVLSHAGKREGAPAVASRFLQRLAAVTGEAWQKAKASGEVYLRHARALDHPAIVKSASRPAPRPPRAARPTYLSVTEVEDWLRDPYTIYARHVLRLRPLDAVDTPPGARDRGTVIHGALGTFTETFARALPADPLAELIAIGQQHFVSLEDYPEARAFWWPRFLRIAHFFIDWEQQRRGDIAVLHAELRGEIALDLGQGRALRLAARADRIEQLHEGGYRILDYKTGRVPSDKEVTVGLAPQLTLEAAILRQGGFNGIAAHSSVAELSYVGAKGGNPPLDPRPIVFKDSDADTEADRALAKLRAVALRFEDEQQPYYPLVLSMWKTRYGQYDHLARVQEWSATGGSDDGGGE